MSVDDEFVPSSQPVHTRGKRKASGDLSASQPVSATKNRRCRSRSLKLPALNPSVISLENIHILNKVDLILNSVTMLKTSHDKLVNKLSEVEGKIENVSKSVDEFREQFITKAPEINAEVILTAIQADLKQVKESLNLQQAEEIDINTQDVLMDMGEPTADTNSDAEEPLVVKMSAKDVIPDLEVKLNNRKHAYYKYVHNRDRLDIHNGWRNQEVPFLPPRFVPKKLGYRETEDEYNVRKQQKFKDFESYLQLLEIRRDAGKKSFEDVDMEVLALINIADISNEDKQAVTEEYTTTVALEEAKSEKRWEKGKKGVEGVIDRSANKIVTEEDRMYAVGPKKGRKKKRKVKPPTTVTVTQPGVNIQQPVPLQFINVSVPPPPLPLNYHLSRTS